MTAVPLFEINAGLDRSALAAAFARDRRVQVRDVLTPQTADQVYRILARGTDWGLAWRGEEGEPAALGSAELRALDGAARQAMGQSVAKAVAGRRYGFLYHRYPMVTAYLQKWAPDGPHDFLLEHINDAPLIELVREVSGVPELVKGDAQATLYAPNQFLALHDDTHVAEGWRVAYVLNFARDWHENWGGYLQFYDDDGDIVAGYKPRFNALNLFAVPMRHAVSYVPPFSPIGRFAITGWFRDR